MSTVICRIPGNPDISGVGVRIAIYIQNFLCFIPAYWALWDGKVTEGELEAAETQATTNLVIAFAILISSIVQAQTLGLTNYHASIVLSMSWMNNTNAFIYFLLYIQRKSQLGIQRRVEPTWSAWVQHIKGLFISIVRSSADSRQTDEGLRAELGHASGVDVTSDGDTIGKGARRTREGDDDARRGARLLLKRFVVLLGSLHLSLMAGLGLWLWSNIWTFGNNEDGANACAAGHA
ncbi:hypothetical protein DFP72DRAFT_1013217, partial [Ephemerocybe angulata]